MRATKETRAIADELRAQGWTVERTTQGHYKGIPPESDKEIIHFSDSSDYHAQLNTIKALRNAGFIWPPPNRRTLASFNRGAALAMVNAGGPFGLDEFVAPSQPVLTIVTDEPVPRDLDPASTEERAEVVVRLPFEPDPEERMDRLFNELKEARAYYTLTQVDEARLEAELRELNERCKSARTERLAARDSLAEKKLHFDQAFNADAEE